MSKPEFYSFKVSRPCIYATVKMDSVEDHKTNEIITYPIYDGRYEHPAGHVLIHGVGYKEGFSHADFIFKGQQYCMRLTEYRTPRSLCRVIKKWIEEITNYKP